MIRLCLIGKDIAHSRSPSLYEDIIDIEFTYELLDVSSADLLPSIEELATRFDGVNITSPYKSYYMKDVLMDEVVENLPGINCISFLKDRPTGTNTDFDGIEIQLRKFLDMIPNIRLIILGDGVMSKLTQIVADKLDIKFDVYSRKQSSDFNELDLSSFMSDGSSRMVVVNACAREYLYNSNMPENSIFWDLNYNNPEQANLISSLGVEYIDGFTLLRDQAMAAVKFWGLPVR